MINARATGGFKNVKVTSPVDTFVWESIKAGGQSLAVHLDWLKYTISYEGNGATSGAGTVQTGLVYNSPVTLNVDYALSLSFTENDGQILEMDKDIICRTAAGRPVKPKTLGQKSYVDAIRGKMIVFGIGPAGTGKTYLAMAMAIQAFKNGEVGRLILTRPAIEAGEKLGFLPGDLQSKIDPYLRPLYDASNHPL